MKVKGQYKVTKAVQAKTKPVVKPVVKPGSNWKVAKKTIHPTTSTSIKTTSKMTLKEKIVAKAPRERKKKPIVWPEHIDPKNVCAIDCEMVGVGIGGTRR